MLFLKVSMNMSIQHFDRNTMIDNRRTLRTTSSMIAQVIYMHQKDVKQVNNFYMKLDI
jgi:hypothetical protein